MIYILPILYTIICYTFHFLFGIFPTNNLKTLSLLLPFIMGIVNLSVVLIWGRKWSRKILLNCSLIVKYGLIPLYLIGGSSAIGAMLASFFPLPLMQLSVLVTIVLCIYGYGILLGAAPYTVAYLARAYKEGVHPKWLVILGGICQFLFSFDVLAMMVLTLKERHKVKTTIAVFCMMCVAVLLDILCVIWQLVHA